VTGNTLPLTRRVKREKNESISKREALKICEELSCIQTRQGITLKRKKAGRPLLERGVEGKGLMV